MKEQSVAFTYVLLQRHVFYSRAKLCKPANMRLGGARC